jgi:hypothetical protein
MVYINLASLNALRLGFWLTLGHNQSFLDNSTPLLGGRVRSSYKWMQGRHQIQKTSCPVGTAFHQ